MEEKQIVNVVMYEQLFKWHFVADRPSKGGVNDDQEVQLSSLRWQMLHYETNIIT